MMKVDAEERSEKTSQLFRNVNKHFHQPLLHLYFRYVTHLGGATFTISAALSLLIVLRDELRWTAVVAAISLTLSHLPVAINKKFYPRRRPYIIMKNTYVPANPLHLSLWTNAGDFFCHRTFSVASSGSCTVLIGHWFISSSFSYISRSPLSFRRTGRNNAWKRYWLCFLPFGSSVFHYVICQHVVSRRND